MAEVLTETSRYWCERTAYNAERDDYELLGVMGPDEYSPFSRNNAYTNYTAAFTLQLARQAWEALEQADAQAAARLRDEMKLAQTELHRFAHVAGRLSIPFDSNVRLILQSDDFFERETLDFARWWPDRSRPLAACVSQERLYRSQVLKQADVVQLVALFPHRFGDEQIRAAYETYEPLTSHDSSLSRCVHAMVAAWLGKEDEALRHWDESVGLDLTPASAAEGIHAACAGGNWQAAIFGFAGVRTRMQSDVLHIDPHLPARWKSLRFPLVWMGQPLRITIERDRVTIEHRGQTPLDARIYNRAARLEPNNTHTVTTA